MDDFQEARAGILVFQLASNDLFLGPSCPSLLLHTFARNPTDSLRTILTTNRLQKAGEIDFVESIR